MLPLPPFELHTPASVEEAVELLARHGADATLLAGGTDLLPSMKLGLKAPRHVVSLKGVRGLAGIERRGDTLVLGAMTPLAALAAEPVVREHATALAEAAAAVGAPQHRRMGTLGGNLRLDTRCRFFDRSAFWRGSLGYCIKKDGDVCHVVEGGRRCVATASNDTCGAAVVLDAEVVLVGPGGQRRVPARSFWISDGARNVAMDERELVVALEVPLVSGRRSAYEKLRRRGAIDFPLLSIAARRDGDAAVVVLSAVSSKPRIVASSAGSPEDLARAVWEQCHPVATSDDDRAWRREMARVLTRRALARLSA